MSHDLMARLTQYSAESDGPEGLVELTSEILTGANEEDGEMIETVTEIQQGARTMVAMESLYQSFAKQGEVNEGTLRNYRESMEALVIACGLPIAASALTPEYSPENFKTAYEYSIEAEEKKEGTLDRIWAWIKEKFQQLVAWFKRVVLRQKAQEEAVVKKAEEVVEELKKSEGEVSGDITLPAAYAKYLVDANGKPVGLQTAIGAAIAMAKTGGKALPVVGEYLNAGVRGDLAGMNLSLIHI